MVVIKRLVRVRPTRSKGREMGIACVARGSAAGSIVTYLLEIANVDPIRYGLLFERFLNPERVNPPDIDIDFADESWPYFSRTYSITSARRSCNGIELWRV